MATSESDDFESADEEMNHDAPRKEYGQTNWWNSRPIIDSESDDDVEYVCQTPITNTVYSRKAEEYRTMDRSSERKVFDKDIATEDRSNCNQNVKSSGETLTCKPNEGAKGDKQGKLGAKKLGTKITPSSDLTESDDKPATKEEEEEPIRNTSSLKKEIAESEMPEEMKSDKKFKDVFKPQGWERLGNEIELPEELTEEKLQPILEKLSLAGQESDTSSPSWGWANWGVSSLMNTASASVSTLTTHVTHGLTLLEESMALVDEPKAIEDGREDSIAEDDTEDQTKDQSPFGFGNLISGVASITKLVESTGSKVMSGGLDTLEAIGKKTMEVLQEGDPGLKKKRAFFLNDANKPNLSQTLREAKEKAENIEKTIEEKEKMRKVHFESLFDDYQGLVHLEALEMLSKQSNIKIQQYLVSLEEPELDSVQKMLEEVEELCELKEDDENEDEEEEKKDFKSRLQEACTDLGINITYEKLHNAFENSNTYIMSTDKKDDRELFEHAISALAQFTALSVERFHKTAELLLIKEHRSTVNEADSLVQLTNILSKQIEVLASSYCSTLNTSAEGCNQTHPANANITTIFLEASNAGSYIQDAFKLLIPIIQVGAI